MRFGSLWFLLDGLGPAARVELDHAVAVGIGHVVGEHGGAAGGLGRGLQQGAQSTAVEDVVPQDQGAGIGADELSANDESLSESFGTRLRGVAKANAQLRAVA